jgi:hypothetical protein
VTKANQMDSRRWQEIERLYYAALEFEASRRRAFLAEACQGDAALEREVESLLRADDRARPFLVGGDCHQLRLYIQLFKVFNALASVARTRFLTPQILERFFRKA